MPVCDVCNIEINEKHFGIHCCRPCAAFFRRTNTLNLLYKCRFEGNCNITTGRRQSCRYCRYQKCLAMGMMKEADTVDVEQIPQTSSATNEQNLFNQDKLYNQESIVSLLNKISTSNLHSNIQMILKRRLDRIFEHLEPYRCQEYTVPLNLCQQGLVSFQAHKLRWPSCYREKVHPNVATNADLDEYFREYYAEVEYVAIFCMGIDVFAKLPKDQKWQLYKYLSPRFHLLERTYLVGLLIGHDNPDIELSYSGLVFDRTTYFDHTESISDAGYQEVVEFLGNTDRNEKKWFKTPLLKMKLTEFELVYMLLSCMFSAPKTKATKETIDCMEICKNRIAEELHQHYIYEKQLNNYADRVHKISNIMAALDKLEDCRLEDMKMSKIFKIFREDVYMSDLLYT